MARKIRFLLYSQHLSGTGHFVRTYEIARALAEYHEVFMIEGGRPIPRSRSGNPFITLNLPPIYRTGNGITPVDISRNVNEVMAERKCILQEFIMEKKPDVLLIEHFPFSKQLLAPEIIPLIQLAKEMNEKSRVVCSLRDIIPRSPRDPVSGQHHEIVLGYLKDHFDAILVHSDPYLVRLQDHIPWTDDIKTPIAYTGYISEKPENAKPDIGEFKSHTVVVSAGGAGSAELITHCINVWKYPGSSDVIRNRVLIVFLPLFLTKDAFTQLEQVAGGHSNIRLMSFTPEFIHYMKAADISISQAGYNTCTNILETRTRSILVPDAKMSDQLPRAELMSKYGMATMIHPGELSVDNLVYSITELLQSPRPEHNIALDGAQKSRQILEKFCQRGL
jgi:predicted glycosyltransferase